MDEGRIICMTCKVLMRGNPDGPLAGHSVCPVCKTAFEIEREKLRAKYANLRISDPGQLADGQAA
jgi:hypothetical protein